MHVIWHYDVATNSDTMFLRFQAKQAKCFMHFWSRQKSVVFVGVKCDEVEGADIVKQTTESMWSPAILFCS